MTAGRMFFLLQTYRPPHKEPCSALNSKPPNYGQVKYLGVVIKKDGLVTRESALKLTGPNCDRVFKFSFLLLAHL